MENISIKSLIDENESLKNRVHNLTLYLDAALEKCEKRWGISEADGEPIDACKACEKYDGRVEWCRVRGLEFDAVNENLPEMTEMYGNDSRKIGSDLYIDDKAENVRA